MLVVDKDTFVPEVLEAEGVVFVDFFGDGCEPCKALLPHVENLPRSIAAGSNSQS